VREKASVLLAGWFSFEQMGATAGDLITRDLVADWLRRAGIETDIATAPPFAGGVDWREVEPDRYSHVVFVCGPFGNGPPVDAMLRRFARRRWLGVNLSMLESLEAFDPFEQLWERDSDRTARPDLVFAAAVQREPVVGVVRVHPQREYGAAARHAEANAAIDALIERHRLAPLDIDTRLDVNRHALSRPAQVESLIARTDLVLTTRLHGLALALRSGVPVVAIDPIAGGAKIARQAATIGWPWCFVVDRLDASELDAAVQHGLTDSARHAARACADRAAALLRCLEGELLGAFDAARPLEDA